MNPRRPSIAPLRSLLGFPQGRGVRADCRRPYTSPQIPFEFVLSLVHGRRRHKSASRQLWRSVVGPEFRLRADSFPSGTASGRTGVRAKAIIPLRARNWLDRPLETTLFAPRQQRSRRQRSWLLGFADGARRPHPAFHSSGSPALRRPSNEAGRFGVCSFSHLSVIAGLRRRASARAVFASSSLPACA